MDFPFGTRFPCMETVNDIIKTVGSNVKAQYQDQSTELLAVSAFAIGAVTAVSGRRLYTRYFRRVLSSEYVTPAMLAKRRWVRGVVTRWAAFIHGR